MSVSRLGLLVASCFLLAALAAEASAAREEEAGEEITTLRIIVLLPGAGGGPAPTTPSTRLPQEITPYLWNRFTRLDETVLTTADSRYREVGGMDARTERLEEFQLELVRIRVAGPVPSGPRAAELRLAFALSSLLGAGRAILYQPGQYALLLLAIQESGKGEGFARVLSVERSRTGGFLARVLVR